MLSKSTISVAESVKQSPTFQGEELEEFKIRPFHAYHTSVPKANAYRMSWQFLGL